MGNLRDWIRSEAERRALPLLRVGGPRMGALTAHGAGGAAGGIPEWAPGQAGEPWGLGESSQVRQRTDRLRQGGA